MKVVCATPGQTFIPVHEPMSTFSPGRGGSWQGAPPREERGPRGCPEKGASRSQGEDGYGRMHVARHPYPSRSWRHAGRSLRSSRPEGKPYLGIISENFIPSDDVHFSNPRASTVLAVRPALLPPYFRAHWRSFLNSINDRGKPSPLKTGTQSRWRSHPGRAAKPYKNGTVGCFGESTIGVSS
jgi:hypothetical protein